MVKIFKNIRGFFGGLARSRFLFQDIPHILDRLFRRIEFFLSSSFLRSEKRMENEEVDSQPKSFSPATIIFSFTVFFSFYGTNLDALYSLGEPFSYVIFSILAIALVILYVIFVRYLYQQTTSIISCYCNRISKSNRSEKRHRKVLKAELNSLKATATVENEYESREIPLSNVNPGLCKLALKTVLVYLPLFILPIIAGFLVYWNSGLDFNLKEIRENFTSAELSLASRIQLISMGGVIGLLLFLDNKYKYLDVSNTYYPSIPLTTFALVGLLMLVVSGYFGTSHNFKESSNLPYVNSYLLGLIALSIPLLISKCSVNILFKKFSGDNPDYDFERRLAVTELFAGKTQSLELSPARTLFGLFIVPFRHLPHLLLFPAFFSMVVPQDILRGTFFFMLILSWVMIYSGGIAKRWNRILFVISRYFFQGLPMLLSYLVIALGLARLANISYVASVLDVAPLGSVTILILMLYVAFWLYDIWLNRPLQVKLFEILGGKYGERGQYPYQCSTDSNANSETENSFVDVLEANRDILLHGSSSFLVAGEIKSNEPGVACTPVYEAWNPLDLFKKLSGDDGFSENTQKNRKLIGAYRSLRRRFLLYRGLMNGLAILSIGLALCLVNHYKGEPEPNLFVKYETEAQTGSVDLLEKLLQQADNEEPAIIFAASGGGTRAALYTYSVLRTLRQLEASNHIVLGSGVSGGGVALAYFSAHYDELTKAPVNNEAWNTFRQKMAEPFIQDVLEGLLEPRLLWKTRTGKLLAESFEARLLNAEKSKSLGESNNLGLLFNTTLTATPYDEADITNRLFKNQLQTQKDPGFTTFAGGRLVLTNLKDVSAFPKTPEQALAQDIYFPTIVLQDDGSQETENRHIPLMTAAALNANFPPVFQDAPIDIETNGTIRRYFVTDGGAMDNRGLITALYALRKAIGKTPEIQEEDGKQKLPETIYIVVAEASATGYDYTSSFGLGAALSNAKMVLANGLIHELQQDVKAQLAKRGSKLETIYLNMPLALRSRGGLGTHWIMPNKVHLRNPAIPKKTKSPEITVNKQQFMCLLDELYAIYTGTNSNPYDESCRNILLNDEKKLLLLKSFICNEAYGNGCKSAGNQAKAWNILRIGYGK